MKKVKLYAPTIGVMEFEKAHADKILARERNGGWVLYIEKKAKSGDKSDSGNTKKSEK